MSAFHRVLSLRDKRDHKRNTTYSKTGNTVGPDYNGLFTVNDTWRKATKEEDKKVAELAQHLATLGHPEVPRARLEYLIRCKSSDGDVKKAFAILKLFDDSVAGILRENDPSIRMLGAENREKTTCYLDSLLFAMFSHVEIFEAVLYNTFQDEPRKRLVTGLRLWVNMIRTGKLVTTDITQQLQDCLADCGWPDAALKQQQDASEAFVFITDRLEMPLVTLKTDIFHAGKEDTKDDHKFITERLLDVAIPEHRPEAEPLTLEECLEEYFNNRVEVKRALLRRNTLQSRASRSSLDKGGANHVETVEVNSSGENSPAPPDRTPGTTFQRPGLGRERTTSIFSERRVEVSLDGENSGDVQSRKRGSSMRKEVLMPAWQFLNLIPWYTNNPGQNNAQVAAHFSQSRPMLGICLKRYTVSHNGQPIRLNTHIDIPLEMSSPHFTSEDAGEDNGNEASNFKLSLQSVICHRGNSIHSGHYISIVRAGARMVGSSEDPRYEDMWLLHDDLAMERVRPVDITAALKEESPYLLFYRVAPILDDPPFPDPPAYSESGTDASLLDHKLAELPPLRTDASPGDSQSRRPSLDVYSPESARGRNSNSEMRRPSIVWTDESRTPSVRLEQIITEPNTPPPDDAVRSGSFLSRQTTRNSKVGNVSRPASVGSEKRFGLSMAKIHTRLGNRDSKILSPDIVVSEVVGDGTIVDTQKCSSPPLRPMQVTSADSIINTDTQRKSKERSMKRFKGGSRRTSPGVETRKRDKPERECIVM